MHPRLDNTQFFLVVTAECATQYSHDIPTDYELHLHHYLNTKRVFGLLPFTKYSFCTYAITIAICYAVAGTSLPRLYNRAPMDNGRVPPVV